MLFAIAFTCKTSLSLYYCHSRILCHSQINIFLIITQFTSNHFGSAVSYSLFTLNLISRSISHITITISTVTFSLNTLVLFSPNFTHFSRVIFAKRQPLQIDLFRFLTIPQFSSILLKKLTQLIHEFHIFLSLSKSDHFSTVLACFIDYSLFGFSTSGSRAWLSNLFLNKKEIYFPLLIKNDE